MYKNMYRKVLECWFNPESEPQWFAKDDEFDNKIRVEFFDIWKSACEGLLYDWRDTVEGRLAEIIVLDQFSRNLCRDKACAFSQDKMALVLAQELLRKTLIVSNRVNIMIDLLTFSSSFVIFISQILLRGFFYQV